MGLREACVAGRLVCSSEKRKSRNDVFTRVYRELVEAEKVFVYDDGARVLLHREVDFEFPANKE